MELGYPAHAQRLYLLNQELDDELEMKDLSSRNTAYDLFSQASLGKSRLINQ